MPKKLFYRGAKLRPFYRFSYSQGKIRFFDKWEPNSGMLPVSPAIIDAYLKEQKGWDIKK